MKSDEMKLEYIKCAQPLRPYLNVVGFKNVLQVVGNNNYEKYIMGEINEIIIIMYLLNH